MDEIAESYTLQSIEQMRGIADSLRIRIFEALAQRAMTATQVGDELEVAAPKAHYHVRELERLGLVKLVETRERGGILEKYYRAIARNLVAPAQLLQSSEPGEVEAAITEIFNNLSRSFLTAMGRIAKQDGDSFEDHMIGMDGTTVWMTPKELKQTLKLIADVIAPYRERRGVPGEREARVTLITYDTLLATLDEGDSASAPPPVDAQRPRRQPVTAVGSIIYTRAELERIVAAGERLDLNVIGLLSFGEDVTPALVDRAIARLRYRGVLSAPSDVREALKRKEV